MAKGGAMAMSGMDKDYQADSDLRCMIEAEKIKQDKTRFRAAMKKQKEMLAALQDIGDAKDMAEEKGD